MKTIKLYGPEEGDLGNNGGDSGGVGAPAIDVTIEDIYSSGEDEATGNEGQQGEQKMETPVADTPGAGDKAAVTPGARQAPVKNRAEIDEERTAKLAARVASETLAAASRGKEKPQEQEPRLSPEQIEKILNPVRITADTLKGLGFGEASPEQVQAFQGFANAVVKNATSVAQLMIEHQLRSTLAPYEPLVNYIQQQQTDAHRNAFYEKHPAMQKHTKLVQFAANQISPNKADGSEKTSDEIFDEVAGVVSETLAASGVQIQSPGNANHSAGINRAAVPRMAALQTPGRSLGGQPNGEQNNPDADIYS